MRDDVDAIARLKARYFRTMDGKDWTGLLGVFTPDVVVDLQAEGSGVVRGAEPYLRFLRSKIEDVVTVHHGHMPEIEVTSATTATGIWAFEDRLWWPEGSPIRHLHGFGHYHETYVRTPDGWRIASLRITRLHRRVER